MKSYHKLKEDLSDPGIRTGIAQTLPDPGSSESWCIGSFVVRSKLS